VKSTVLRSPADTSMVCVRDTFLGSSVL